MKFANQDKKTEKPNVPEINVIDTTNSQVVEKLEAELIKWKRQYKIVEQNRDGLIQELNTLKDRFAHAALEKPYSQAKFIKWVKTLDPENYMEKSLIRLITPCNAKWKGRSMYFIVQQYESLKKIFLELQP